MTILPKSRQSNIVIQEFPNEILIYDLITNNALCLNQTLATVYELADGTKTASEISRVMTGRLKIFVSEDVIWLALDRLRENNLLEESAAIKIDFGGLSRREIVKKIGLASMIAIPVISSIIAPRSIEAASCVDNGGRCNFDGSFTQGSCCSGLRCNNRSACQSCIASGMPYDVCGNGCSSCNNAIVFPRKNICCSSGVATTSGGSCICP